MYVRTRVGEVKELPGPNERLEKAWARSSMGSDAAHG